MKEKIKESALTDELNEIFDNPPEVIIPEKKEVCTIIEPTVVIPTTREKPHEDLADDDFNYSRQNLHDVIDVGVDALKNLSEMAQSATSPRYHEVIGELMKNISDSTKELFDLHQKMKIFKRETEPSKVTNNNLIVTTNELLQIIKEHNNK